MPLEVDPNGLKTIFSNTGKETELAKLFSGETAVRSPDESLLFLKKIVAISISNLLFLRNVLPDISFQKFICDKSMSLNLLCPVNANNDVIAIKVISNLLDVFVGIEDKYVKELTICFLYKDTDDVAVTEICRFHFEYMDEVSVTFSHDKNSEESVKDDKKFAALYTKNAKQLIGNTRSLIRQIQTLCMRIDPIPEDANPKVEISAIYNENAPSDYQLPGWKKAKVSPPSANEGKTREPQLWLGNVETPFHAMKLDYEALEGETDYFKHVYGKE